MQATIEVQGGVLRAVITGTYSAADAMELRSRVGALIEESGVRLGVVDLRGATITHTTLEIYDINTSLSDFIPLDTRFAFVYAPDALPRELAAFSEDVLVNSGYEARVCTDMDEALRWVKGES